MPDQVDQPGQDPATPRQGEDAGSQPSETPPAPAPFKHTRWQLFIRDMFQVFGPAQTGLKPYATPEEREEWRLANLPQPKEHKPAPPPPGYQITEYRDGQGYVHRSLVPITPPRGVQPGSPAQAPTSPESDKD